MSGARKYLISFLLRTAVCLIILLLLCLARRFWPQFGGLIREKALYNIDFGLFANELKALGGCVLP